MDVAQTSASSYSRLGNRLGDLEQLFYSGQTKKHQRVFFKSEEWTSQNLGIDEKPEKCRVKWPFPDGIFPFEKKKKKQKIFCLEILWD